MSKSASLDFSVIITDYPFNLAPAAPNSQRLDARQNFYLDKTLWPIVPECKLRPPKDAYRWSVVVGKLIGADSPFNGSFQLKTNER